MARLASFTTVLTTSVLSLSIAAGLAPAMAQSARACPHAESDQDKIALTLKAAATCKMAYDLMNACRSNTSGDVALAEIVIERCEGGFLTGASAAARRAYEMERQACRSRYAKSRGTMYVSFAATCEAGVASRYASEALRRSRSR